MMLFLKLLGKSIRLLILLTFFGILVSISFFCYFMKTMVSHTYETEFRVVMFDIGSVPSNSDYSNCN